MGIRIRTSSTLGIDDRYAEARAEPERITVPEGYKQRKLRKIVAESHPLRERLELLKTEGGRRKALRSHAARVEHYAGQQANKRLAEQDKEMKADIERSRAQGDDPYYIARAEAELLDPEKRKARYETVYNGLREKLSAEREAGVGRSLPRRRAASPGPDAPQPEGEVTKPTISWSDYVAMKNSGDPGQRRRAHEPRIAGQVDESTHPNARPRHRA